jgi:hypothetical protein
LASNPLAGFLSTVWWHQVSNQRLLKETRMWQVTCTDSERLLQQFGYVTRLPETDPVHGDMMECGVLMVDHGCLGCGR